MLEWTTATVEECLEPISFRSASKLQTQDYRSVGAYPIIDQGQGVIAGWTDDDRGLIAAHLPVVVFGDHTRTFKYVDFPFVRGADGTQILKPKSGLDPLYFYYACRAIDLPSRGYNRHFQALREKEIAIPPADEQRDIAQALSVVDSAAILQSDQIQSLTAAKRAAMHDLFTRGLLGERQKQTDMGRPAPESWKELPISALGQVVTGTTPPTRDPANYVGGKIPFIAPGDIEDGCHIEVTEKYITDRGLDCSRPITRGTTCFVCIGSTIGKVGYATMPIGATNQQINSILPSDAFDPLFVFYLMSFWADHVRKQASPSPVPILSKGGFEQITIAASPNSREQHDIAAILSAVDRKIDLHKRKRAVLDELFKALLHNLMAREIRVSDLDLSVLRLTEVAA